MSDRKPEHGEIVVVTYPASKRRRRWCGTCSMWTWETGWLGSNIWRHGRGSRTRECQATPEPPR